MPFLQCGHAPELLARPEPPQELHIDDCETCPLPPHPRHDEYTCPLPLQPLHLKYPFPLHDEQAIYCDPVGILPPRPRAAPMMLTMPPTTAVGLTTFPLPEQLLHKLRPLPPHMPHRPTLCPEPLHTLHR